MTLSSGQQDVYCNAWDAAGNDSAADSIGVTYDPTVSIGTPSGAMFINSGN